MSSFRVSHIDTFGEVAAEDDPVLSYFLSTSNVQEVESNKKFLVLGRKGAGKTAIYRHFTEGPHSNNSVALNLRSYQWNFHSTRIDRGASDIEAYVASWRYLIAVEIAAFVLKKSQGQHHDEQRPLRDYLQDNYGSTDPMISQILRPKRLNLGSLKILPSFAGFSLGGVDLTRDKNDMNLGYELETVTKALINSSIRIFKHCQLGTLYIQFDELDHGLETLDDRRGAMTVGLIIGARDMRRILMQHEARIFVTIYLRTDIWDELSFSDKNKITQTSCLHLEWDNETLLDLIERRIKAKLGKKAGWTDLIDDQLMRGSQQKWNHIVARTLKRPRDVIQFLNSALKICKHRDPSADVFINKDIVDARNDYSTYLKRELDDEIEPHWPAWEEALQACSAIATEKFEKGQFVKEYSKRKSSKNHCDPDEALKLLYRFSVIGYEKRSGYGGSGWAFLYEDPDLGWDSAVTKFKVHPGLKEYAKLREER
jgi:hypothetical protein